MANANAVSRRRQASTTEISVSATGAQIAELIGRDPSRIRQLKAEGVIKPRSDGRYKLVPTMQAIFANATAASADDDGLKAAKRREVEQRIAMRDHRLIDIEESDAVMDEVFGMLKSELLGIPARVSRELDLRSKVEREIDDALNRAADRLAKRAAELRTTGKMGT